MHNLLLGTAKYITETWKSNGILTSNHFDIIQKKVDSFVTPTDIGRVPFKISSGFSSFIAEQWKNWIIYFSLFALKDILPWNHYKCWHLFVKVCFLLCQRTVAQQQLNEADHHLNEFWKEYKALYGAKYCTMNIHLHGHLTECIRDFGPVYSFWCFAYERMNGVLGAFHTNHHHISVQYMHRFLDSKIYSPVYWPTELVDDFLPLLQSSVYNKGSLMQANIESDIVKQQFLLLPPVKEVGLSPDNKKEILPHFEKILNGKPFEILTLCGQSHTLGVGNFVLGAKGSYHSNPSLVLANHEHTNSRSLAEMQYFLECTALVNGTDTASIWIACIQ